jgi:hypothetical protein
LCFNELSQVEDHYSLSGLSPASARVLLLLCGEGDLTVRDAKEQQETGSSPTAAEEAFSSFWASADPGEATPQTAGEAQRPDERRSEGDIILSVSELGDRFAVKMRKELAARIQALRAMLRFVFRVFCREPSRWPELLAEGQPGSIVIDLATQILRAEVGASDNTAHDYADAVVHSNMNARADIRPATQKAIEGNSKSPKAKANKQSKESFYPGVGVNKPKKEAGPKLKATTVVCGTCGRECSESEGAGDGKEAWYCFDCWERYYASQQQQQQPWQTASWWQQGY